MSAVISGLLPGTLYHFRVVATNALGTRTSLDGTFTTLAAYTGYQSWLLLYAVGGPMADDNRAGVPNLFEFAFGLNPRIASDGQWLPLLAVIELIEGRYVLRFFAAEGY